MTKLVKHVDEMRERLRQTAISEQSLVKDLADSLKLLDQQLLHDVRQAAADHQARRGTILYALEDLADAIGMFRPQHEDALPKPVAVSQPVARPQPAAAIREQIDYGYQYSPPTGDWREATKNLNLQDELELHLNGLNGKTARN
jgi:hypothetical protein